jgi:hypothetical protein
MRRKYLCSSPDCEEEHTAAITLVVAARTSLKGVCENTSKRRYFVMEVLY